MSKLLSRISGKYERTAADRLFRRMVTINATTPFISFSFDDAPRTALSNGGGILKANGVAATFFVSLGMLGCDSPSGTITTQDDLLQAVAEGYELGCHSYHHLDPWETTVDVFEQSVLKNRQTLARMIPGAEFKTFAYPLRSPRPVIKRRMGKLFNCCRGGGQQAFNVGTIDLNLVKAYFIDKRNADSINAVKRMIDQNSEHRGWLIFATHDVANYPSPYGCTQKYFGEVVEYAVRSNSIIMPVGKAWEKLCASNYDCLGKTENFLRSREE